MAGMRAAPGIIAGAVSATAGLFGLPSLAVLIGPFDGTLSSPAHLLYLPVLPFASLLDFEFWTDCAVAGAVGYGAAGFVVASLVALIRRYGWRGLFDDPLTRRELSGVSRRWQTFVARTLVGLVMAWAVYTLWRRSGRAYRHGDFSAMASVSRDVFMLYFGGLMAFLPLLAVSAASDLVTKEVRNGTLGLLFLTPLTPWRIAAGKWKAAMAQVLMILFAGGPVAAICVYLGGIGGWEILWSAALPLATAAFAAAVSIFFSTVFGGPAMTVIVSILALLAGTFVPVWMLRGPRGGGFEFLARVHPLFAALVTAEPNVARSLELSLYAWISATFAAVLGAWAIVAFAARRLPARLLALPGPSLLSRFMTGLDGFYESINVGRVRFLTRSGDVWESRALLWKELRMRTSGKLRHATRIALGLLILGVIPLAAPDLRDGVGFFLWVFPGLLLLQAVVGGVSLFVNEREGRQWDVLLSTPLTSDQIVFSKLAGGLAGLAPTAVAWLLYASAVCLFQVRGMEVWCVTMIPAGLFALFAYVLSAAASMRATSLRGAFGLSTGILLAIVAGLPALAEATRLLRDESVLASTNPAFYLERACRRLFRSYGWGYDYFGDGGYFILYLFLYGGATLGILAWMRTRFDRLAGRA